MQRTLFTLLTNKRMRAKSAVAASLRREFAAGAPWYDAAQKRVLVRNG